jgi:hypothetical protein
MDQPAKTKVYEAPKLVRYGDLVEVTLNIQNGPGKIDSLKGQHKT